MVWGGGRQRPRYSPEGWPDMTPRDSSLLIWVGTSEQAARRGTEDSYVPPPPAIPLTFAFGLFDGGSPSQSQVFVQPPV